MSYPRSQHKEFVDAASEGRLIDLMRMYHSNALLLNAFASLSFISSTPEGLDGTALHAATCANKPHIVRFLVESKADLSLKTRHQQSGELMKTALDWAWERKQLDIILILQNQGGGEDSTISDNKYEKKVSLLESHILKQDQKISMLLKLVPEDASSQIQELFEKIDQQA
jgi:hypothetical protein